MERFIPKDKLSKKAKKRLDRQPRLLWSRPPVPQTFESKKTYKRQKSHRQEESFDNQL